MTEQEEYFCPVCRCEKFFSKDTLCVHIMICARSCDESPVIINPFRANVKSEPVDVLQVTCEKNVPPPDRFSLGQANVQLLKEECVTSANLIDLDDAVHWTCAQCSLIFLSKTECDFHSEHCQAAVRNSNSLPTTSRYRATIVSHIVPVNDSTVVNMEMEDSMLPEPSSMLQPQFYVCQLCNGKKPGQYKLKRNFHTHLQKVHNYSPRIFLADKKLCKYCNIRASSFDELLEHYNSCLELQAFRETATKTIYNTRKHNMIKCCLCVCGDEFILNDYYVHIKEVHDLDKSKRFPRKDYQCVFCSLKLTSFKKLIAHCQTCDHII